MELKPISLADAKRYLETSSKRGEVSEALDELLASDEFAINVSEMFPGKSYSTIYQAFRTYREKNKSANLEYAKAGTKDAPELIAIVLDRLAAAEVTEA